MENSSALRELLSSRTRRLPTEEVSRLLRSHSVPCSPIQDIAQVVDDPQVRANRIFEPQEHPRIPGYRDMKMSIRFDGERPALKRVPPSSGEHTAEIMGELGYDGGAVQAYQAGLKR